MQRPRQAVLAGEKLVLSAVCQALIESTRGVEARLAALVGLLLSLVLTCAVSAQSPSEWPDPRLLPVVGGLEQPVAVVHAGDGTGRLFVAEQPGRVRLFKDGTMLQDPFLDITDRVSCCGERGLLSVAFPPGYGTKGRFYVNYTDRSGNTVVARYRVSSNPDLAQSASEEILLTIAQPFANHNGGQLAFGPSDGYLYIGTGDGGSAGDPQNNAQSPTSLLGKLLRIDVESGAQPYGIPITNPYAQTPGYRAEIWALGLRNPWRFAFDGLSGGLYIGDVGQGQWEEIDFQPASSVGGENYGWRVMEGSRCFNPSECDSTGLVFPVAEYSHARGWCSVTGGGVYRGSVYPRMHGVYFYGDYCTGTIWGLRREGQVWSNAILAEAGFPISSFGHAEDGSLYVIDYRGSLYLLADTQVAQPTPTETHTPSPTNTDTPEPTATDVPTSTVTLTATRTNTRVPTLTGTHRVYLPIIIKRWPAG